MEERGRSHPEGQGGQGTLKEGRVFPPELIKSCRTQDAGPDLVTTPILVPVFSGDDKPYPGRAVEKEPWAGAPENSIGFLAPPPITEGGLWGRRLPSLSLGFLFSGRGPPPLPLPGPRIVCWWPT